jgi:sterol desaturase/sphingolipid hydroxylase (fatty acid hydroxylase superfamily)
VVPFFIGIMGLEYYFSRKRQLEVHQFNESVANINVGIAERMTDIFVSGMFFKVFTWIYENWAIVKLPQNWLTWIGIFLLTDLVWYWYHRMGHRVNLFWSAHVVHHQSEDFNYTTSVRITVFQAVARGLFWCILPLAGFSPLMITVLLMIHGAYPFFTHTQLIGKLGWLEKMIVTPSHHRVHHSSNPEYLDKNYGDMLIIWDKLFGTFAEETVTPVYGLTKPLKSHSFLWQHFHFYLEMILSFKRARGWKSKFKIIFGKPDDIDPRIRTWLEYKLLSRNKDIELPRSVQHFIAFQTFLTLVCLFLTIFYATELTKEELILSSVFILVSVIYTGAMLDKKSWVFHLELIRLVLIGCFTYCWLPSTIVLLGLLLLIAPGIVYYRTLYHYYNRVLFGFQ